MLTAQRRWAMLSLFLKSSKWQFLSWRNVFKQMQWNDRNGIWLREIYHIPISLCTRNKCVLSLCNCFNSYFYKLITWFHLQLTGLLSQTKAHTKESRRWVLVEVLESNKGMSQPYFLSDVIYNPKAIRRDKNWGKDRSGKKKNTLSYWSRTAKRLLSFAGRFLVPPNTQMHTTHKHST